MGGINHQPCNRPGTNYLQYSTLMSRALSGGRSCFEQANIELENILLSEMGLSAFPNAGIPGIRMKLEESCNQLRELTRNADLLVDAMRQHDYQDLAKLLNVDLWVLVQRLQGRGLASPEMFVTVTKVLQEGTFYDMIARFSEDALRLIALSQALMDRLDTLREVDSVTAVVEQNHRQRNIKIEFARLYNAWNSFQELFLASSMISTELWYMYQGVGSLVDDGVQKAVVV